MKKQCCPKLPYKKVTHVIFDLDGTILDTESLIEEVVTEICKKCGTTFPPALHNKTAGSLVEDIAILLKKELNLSLSVEEFVQTYNELTTARCSDINFMPGAEELIKHFDKHKVPIAVATSSAEDLMLLKTKRHRKVFDLFHHIVCGGSDPEVKAGKPAPDIFLVCASRFPDNPDPSTCLVLEDAPNGIKGALRAGMQAVIIPQDDVPYEIWKTATLRLDSLQFMAPELFGLPPMEVKGVPVPKISFNMHFEEKKIELPKSKKTQEKEVTAKKEELKEESKKNTASVGEEKEETAKKEESKEESKKDTAPVGEEKEETAKKEERKEESKKDTASVGELLFEKKEYL